MDCRAVVLAGLLAAASPVPAEEAILERVPLKTAVPEYPDAALRDRVEGEVQVCFEVDRRGRPWRIAVRSSTHRIFERPSIRAVRASSFVPLADDEPLPAVKSCRTFRFSLPPVQDEAASVSMRTHASASVSPTLTSPPSWPAMTASPEVGKSVSRHSRSNSRAIPGVP